MHSSAGSSRLGTLLVALLYAAACSSNTPGDDDTMNGTPKAGAGGTGGGAGRGAAGAPSTGGTPGGAGGPGSGATGGVAGMPMSVGGAGGASAGAGGVPGGTGGAGGTVAGLGGQGNAAGVGPQGGAAGSAAGAGAAAGTATAGSTGTAGGGAGGSGGAATGFFHEDFEASTTGMQPTGWDNFISYQKNNPMNPAGSIAVLTDTMHVHGGTKAVHMHGDGSPAQLVRALPKNLTKLYVRAWVFLTRQLGQHTETSANHESLIVLRRKSGDANDEVRFGEIKGVVGTNEVPSDNISPTMDKWHQATGPLVAANVWTCLEVSFLADAMPNTLHATAGGMSIHDITGIGTDQWQNGAMPATWLATKFAGDGGNAPEIVLGWQSFSSAANDVWMDDIVLSNDPIGCN
jgi:hypothetical protein